MSAAKRVRCAFVWMGCVTAAVGVIGYVGSCIRANVPIRGNAWSIDLENGALEFSFTRRVPGMQTVLGPRLGSSWLWLPDYWFTSNPANPKDHYGGVVIPYWVLIVIGSPGCYLSIPRWVRPGRCVKCGYDLRGVPDLEGVVRCPECGNVDPRS